MAATHIDDSRGKNPQILYAKHNKRVKRTEDRYLQYAFRCAIYYVEGGREPGMLKWWNWKY